jgi:hypothetical protein
MESWSRCNENDFKVVTYAILFEDFNRPKIIKG